MTSPDGYDRGAGTHYAATGAAGEFVAYVVPIAQAGTYDVVVGLLKTNAAGQFQLAIADAPFGPWREVGGTEDTYAAPSTFAKVHLMTPITFAAPGQKYFRFSLAGRNDASSGYGLSLDYVEPVLR